LTNFALDPETILKGLQEGQPVPAPRHHIRYSLMLVVALLAGGWLWTQKNYWSTRTERLVFGALLLFLGISLHLLTVRSALVAFYLALLFTLLRYWWQSKNWKLGLLGLCLLVLAPLIAVTQVKSVQNRLAYMRYDWEHFRSAKGGENYSDAERFVSLEVGVRLWLEQPLLGVGMGDLERETQKMTDRIHPEYSETPKLPHNQIIYILAGTGLLGLLLSMWAWLYPLWFKTYRRSYLFMVFQVVVLVSFLVEYTFETSIGTAFCLFYQLWTMKMAECLEAGLSPLEAKPGV
jgi:O-antigen ligase